MRTHVNMILGIYGFLQPYHWVDINDLLGSPMADDPYAEDAYSLFFSRSENMGWATDALSSVETEVLWAMHEADFSERSTENPTESTLVAWFQVGVPRKDRHPLPILPALACAHDTVHRMGKLRLDALQVMLPSMTPARYWDQAAVTAEWFHLHDPEGLTAVRATVDGGTVAAIGDHAQEILEMLQTLDTSPFRFVAVSRSPADFVEPAPPVVSEDWFPPSRDRVTFEILSPGWSIDTAAWIASLLSTAVCQEEPFGPAMLSIGQVV